MKKWTTLLYLWWLAALALPAAAQDVESITFPPLNPLEIPKVEKIQLDNGLRLYLLTDKSLPLFNVNVRLAAGSYLEPGDQAGLAEITGTVMRTGGTRTWTGDQIDELLEGIGGMVETNFGDVEGGAFVNVLSDYADTGLLVLAEVLRYPRFDQDKIDLAMVQARTNIARRNDEVSEIALREFRKLIYGAESPYARTMEYATLDKVTRDDLVAFHDRYVRPENIQMAIYGDFDKNKVLARVKKLFGDWKKGTAAVPPPPVVDYQWRKQVYYAEKKGAKQSYIRMGHLGGMLKDPDYADKIVMNSILGLGFGSRLTDEVRTRLGLAYSAGGRYVSNAAYPGYFFALASTDPGNTVKACRAMIEQIRSMQTVPPTDMEMKKGKDGYLNSFVFNFDSRREVIGRIMSYDFYGLPEDFLQREKTRVEQTTKDDVVAAAKRSLHPDSMVILVVGDKEKFDLPLDSLGWGPIEAVDISIPAPQQADQEELVVNDANIAKGMEILGKAIAAHGGTEAFAGVTSVVSTRSIKLVMGGQELPATVNSWEVIPDKEKSEISIMGQKIISLRVGQQGWRTDQTGQMVPLSADEVAEGEKERLRETIRVFQAYGNPYYKAVYNGRGELGGTPVEWVAILDASGEQLARFGFDAGSHTLAAKMYFDQTMMGEGMVTEKYSNLQPKGKITLPTVTVTELNGQKIMEENISVFDVNTAIAAEVFAPPQ